MTGLSHILVIGYKGLLITVLNPVGIYLSVVSHRAWLSLSSILFNLFISDLGRELKFCKYHKYADDFKLYISGPLATLAVFIEQIQTDINYVVNWAESNGLKLNPNKS